VRSILIAGYPDFFLIQLTRKPGSPRPNWFEWIDCATWGLYEGFAEGFAEDFVEDFGRSPAI
jgi:hypothetical protein